MSSEVIAFRVDKKFKEFIRNKALKNKQNLNSFIGSYIRNTFLPEFYLEEIESNIFEDTAGVKDLENSIDIALGYCKEIISVEKKLKKIKNEMDKYAKELSEKTSWKI